MTELRLGMIGFGAIGQQIARQLSTVPVGAILSTPRALEQTRAVAPAGALVTADWDAFAAFAPTLVVECAGHAALRALGVRVLGLGADLVIASVGALADHETEADLRRAAERGGRIVIPSGALGGLDVLGSARHAGLDKVRYESRKAPAAWLGTPAEDTLDLRAVTSPVVFFTGTAREAALAFPKNANVAATVALAGTGFDATEVALIADPEATGNRHVILASGAFGEIAISVNGRVLPDNPKSSVLAPSSLTRAIEMAVARCVI
ncbi:aspartate dehydrogenase [Falsirhodobacter xinxiangensis]|uniref:aspartate dehydrogenase n=1 Tax=Falsirhodobacter xinxiangensis TaxID=2530049 RepID=UPI00145B76E5|nr:aspartate dehydrogenase [Rhodobacter xinxiangensis]